MSWLIEEPAELDDTAIPETPFNGEAQPLQDLRPSYVSINGPSGGVIRNVAESPVTPGAAD